MDEVQVQANMEQLPVESNECDCSNTQAVRDEL